MAQKKSNLIVVAHPDDETIFFAGLVLRNRKTPWRLICVTNGNGDGRGGQRWLELQNACKKLGIKSIEQWNFADQYEKRLDVKALCERLQNVAAPHQVFTHSPLGEYGHPHHQDVSMAVHQAFGGKNSVWSVAYNCRPEKVIALSKSEYERKTEILRKVYGLETQRFLHLIPAAAVEGFVKLKKSEVASVYEAITNGTALSKNKSARWAWLSPIHETAYFQLKRPF